MATLAAVCLWHPRPAHAARCENPKRVAVVAASLHLDATKRASQIAAALQKRPCTEVLGAPGAWPPPAIAALAREMLIRDGAGALLKRLGANALISVKKSGSALVQSGGKERPLSGADAAAIASAAARALALPTAGASTAYAPDPADAAWLQRLWRWAESAPPGLALEQSALAGSDPKLPEAIAAALMWARARALLRSDQRKAASSAAGAAADAAKRLRRTALAGLARLVQAEAAGGTSPDAVRLLRRAARVDDPWVSARATLAIARSGAAVNIDATAQKLEAAGDAEGAAELLMLECRKRRAQKVCARVAELSRDSELRGRALLEAGSAASAAGDHTGASRLCEQAIPLLKEQPRLVLLARYQVASGHIGRGDDAAATPVLRAALDTAGDAGPGSNLPALLHEAWGRLQMRRGDKKGAAAALVEAARGWLAAGDVSRAGRVYVEAARASVDSGDEAGAAAAVASAKAVLGEGQGGRLEALTAYYEAKALELEGKPAAAGYAAAAEVAAKARAWDELLSYGTHYLKAAIQAKQPAPAAQAESLWRWAQRSQKGAPCVSAQLSQLAADRSRVAGNKGAAYARYQETLRVVSAPGRACPAVEIATLHRWSLHLATDAGAKAAWLAGTVKAYRRWLDAPSVAPRDRATGYRELVARLHAGKKKKALAAALPPAEEAARAAGDTELMSTVLDLRSHALLARLKSKLGTKARKRPPAGIAGDVNALISACGDPAHPAHVGASRMQAAAYALNQAGAAALAVSTARSARTLAAKAGAGEVAEAADSVLVAALSTQLRSTPARDTKTLRKRARALFEVAGDPEVSTRWRQHATDWGAAVLEQRGEHGLLVKLLEPIHAQEKESARQQGLATRLAWAHTALMRSAKKRSEAEAASRAALTWAQKAGGSAAGEVSAQVLVIALNRGEHDLLLKLAPQAVKLSEGDSDTARATAASAIARAHASALRGALEKGDEAAAQTHISALLERCEGGELTPPAVVRRVVALERALRASRSDKLLLGALPRMVRLMTLHAPPARAAAFHRAVAWWHDGRGDNGAALAAMQEALSVPKLDGKREDHFQTLHQAGVLLSRQGRHGEALPLLQRAAKLADTPEVRALGQDARFNTYYSLYSVALRSGDQKTGEWALARAAPLACDLKRSECTALKGRLKR